MNAIVITSINHPTEAVRKFAEQEEYRVVVVADRKTPNDWRCENVDFLSLEKQKSFSKGLCDALPYNHYCRKILGYVYAANELKATCIVDTDDDNLPYNNWAFPAFNHKGAMLKDDRGFVNIYKYFTDEKIWPRGLPINLINKYSDSDVVNGQECEVGIWQGLADKDTDVDAIYRLVLGGFIEFDEKPPIALSEGTVAPFNSQNTQIRRELFPLLYLPSTVTFRYTDILRGLVAQPVMWAAGYSLGFTKATVYQERNEHDLFRDFISEIPMYESGHRIVDIVSSVVMRGKGVKENLHNAYKALLKEDIVGKEELRILEQWLRE